MVQVSTARKLFILARVAAQHAGRSRTAGAAWRAARVTATHFTRVAHVLWLEVTGFVFLGIAAIAGFAFFREYAKYGSGQAETGRIVAAACVTLLFAWFGVSSFWRARKKG
jgi:hypothetical protein